MRIFLMACIISVLFVWVGCGAGGDLVDRFCNANCNKLESCNMLGGLSADVCRANCKSSGQQGVSGGCTPSTTAVDACLAAIEATSCPYQAPAACQNLCGSSGGPEQSGGDGGSGDSAGQESGADANNGGGCGALQGSCVHTSKGNTTCNEFSGQLPQVLAAAKAKCQSEEGSTWTESACRTAASGFNFGCEHRTAYGCTGSYVQLKDAQQKATANQGCVMGGGKVLIP